MDPAAFPVDVRRNPRHAHTQPHAATAYSLSLLSLFLLLRLPAVRRVSVGRPALALCGVSDARGAPAARPTQGAGALL